MGLRTTYNTIKKWMIGGLRLFANSFKGFTSIFQDLYDNPINPISYFWTAWGIKQKERWDRNAFFTLETTIRVLNTYLVTMAFAFTKNPGIFCKCKCHCWVWRMVDSLYYSSRKISERCENSFVNYRIYYQKLCYSLQRIWTKPLYNTSSAFTKLYFTEGFVLFFQSDNRKYKLSINSRQATTKVGRTCN